MIAMLLEVTQYQRCEQGCNIHAFSSDEYVYLVIVPWHHWSKPFITGSLVCDMEVFRKVIIILTPLSLSVSLITDMLSGI